MRLLVERCLIATPFEAVARHPPGVMPAVVHRHRLRSSTSAERPWGPRREGLLMIQRMVLFGASGDLTSRLLLPAVSQLAERDALPPGLTIVGAALTDWTTQDFRDHVAERLREHSRLPRPPTRPPGVGPRGPRHGRTARRRRGGHREAVRHRPGIGPPAQTTPS